MSENDILYRHLRDDKNVPYATLAMIYKNKNVYIGASLCSKGDNFSYKRGREIANYRLNALLSGKVPQQLVFHAYGVYSFEDAENILHATEVVHYYDKYSGLSIYKLEIDEDSYNGTESKSF